MVWMWLISLLLVLLGVTSSSTMQPYMQPVGRIASISSEAVSLSLKDLTVTRTGASASSCLITWAAHPDDWHLCASHSAHLPRKIHAQTIPKMFGMIIDLPRWIYIYIYLYIYMHIIIYNIIIYNIIIYNIIYIYLFIYLIIYYIIIYYIYNYTYLCDEPVPWGVTWQIESEQSSDVSPSFWCE